MFHPLHRLHVLLSVPSKTIKVTNFQLGEATNDVNLIVSTIAGAEHLLGFLSTAKSHGKKVNVRSLMS